MKCTSILFTFLLITNIAYSQNTITGQVIDAETGQPIPFVNIGIVELLKGTVSTQNGAFTLGYNGESDEVSFSAIGFEPAKRTVKELLANSAVMLQPVRYELDEITVEEKALGRIKDMGFNLKKRGHSIGFGSTLLGTEIGGLIDIDRETIIYSAHFIFNHTGNDSLLFRVNLYEMENDKPGRNLIPENVLFNPPKEPGTATVDLRKFDLVTDKSVLLSVEWVEAVSLDNQEIQDISFRADRKMRRPNTWYRSTSLAPFMKMDQYVKYNIGFYLTAQQVKK
ncbi:MAG: hypothetical protein CL670_06150 [Balneola sp.]|jgi:hypothetical protein|nr:hypothetical protein [Balneola sp.]MBE78718.1 hypothetical protein [Balneola sp.]|tara:strand:- start:1638 stop:2480 length:843 start_codon:yes stop_codon:yes gene_type:complete